MKKLVKRALGAFGIDIVRGNGRFTQVGALSVPKEDVYNRDGLVSVHDHSFMQDPAFQRAYQRGVKAIANDYSWEWRVHVGLWAATAASKLQGDFVECGVNYGFLSSAIMEYLDWNSLGRSFYLLDTFAGLDERYLTAEEERRKNQEHLQTGFYNSRVDVVRANFAQWQGVRIIVGSVPDTLDQVDSDKIAYLHLDMNCAAPEIAAAAFFWDRLVPGAFVLLDDYAYHGYSGQKTAMDDFADSKGISILSLPTGQGLFVKPA